jgi:hypothetical protein
MCAARERLGFANSDSFPEKIVTRPKQIKCMSSSIYAIHFSFFFPAFSMERSASIPQTTERKIAAWEFVSMTKGLVFIALVGAAIVAATTNPTKKDHLQAISDRNAIVGGLVELGSALGGVNYKNYVVASMLSINGKNITIGMFRNVVILNEENSK